LKLKKKKSVEGGEILVGQRKKEEKGVHVAKVVLFLLLL